MAEQRPVGSSTSTRFRTRSEVLAPLGFAYAPLPATAFATTPFIVGVVLLAVLMVVR
ncbi:MAG TPA: hypothetical protein VFC19_27085 [Candidatus Limnocylindrales bacterium]|nr:hypothetical protein [Candidatus Limnocylindrales bacterium]